MPDSEKMQRVSKQNPCSICGKSDWCLTAEDGSAAICARIEESSVKQCGDAGWLHILCDNSTPRTRLRVRTVRLKQQSPLPNIGKLAAEYGAAVNSAELQDFAAELGVSVKTLVRLQIGWAGECRAWSFPMYSANEQVRGIRLRSWSGKKWSVKGGKDGLFLPVGLDCSKSLLITEGPTDTAALLDLDFEAVGRSSCNSGVKMLCELVKQRKPAWVVIVADNDTPGLRGARNLASVLLAYHRLVRVIHPPDGIKDARAWLRAGAKHEDIQTSINTAPI